MRIASAAGRSASSNSCSVCRWALCRGVTASHTQQRHPGQAEHEKAPPEYQMGFHCTHSVPYRRLQYTAMHKC